MCESAMEEMQKMLYGERWRSPPAISEATNKMCKIAKWANPLVEGISVN